MTDLEPIRKTENYFGFRLDELVGETCNEFEFDLGIFAKSWETRTRFFPDEVPIRPSKALVLDFEDAPNTCDPSGSLSKISGQCETIKLGSHYEIGEAITKLLEAISSKPDILRGRVFIDITCIPKYFVSYVIWEILGSKATTELILGYSAGTYTHGEDDNVYDQGVREYLSVPHSCNSGTSTRRACIAALGADERLIVDYFQNESGFDEQFLVAADAISNLAVRERVNRQIDALCQHFELDETHVKKVTSLSFIESLRVFEGLISPRTDYDSWDIFCSGPKPHSVVANLIAMKHDSVKVVGRTPLNYDTKDVVASGMFSLLRIIDLTNPRVAKLETFEEPF